VNKDRVIFLLIGIVLGAIVGFAVTNGINRSEHDKLRAELASLRSGSSNSTSGQPQPRPSADEDSIPTLTDEQLRAAVAKADANPSDVKLQQISGQGLYVYARQKGNAAILPDVIRILKRAQEAEPKNVTTSSMLGDALFLQTQTTGDTSHLTEARKYYQKALALDPDQVYVRTSLGLTYFFDRPSNPRSAIKEYRKALELDPRHEPTLRGLVAALAETGEFEEAEKRLKELEALSPTNEELPNLRAQLQQKKNEAKGQR
jgi:tetratricopeptide (TPR) repeat protein